MKSPTEATKGRGTRETNIADLMWSFKCIGRDEGGLENKRDHSRPRESEANSRNGKKTPKHTTYLSHRFLHR